MEKNLQERPGSFFYTTLPPSAETMITACEPHSNPRNGTHREKQASLQTLLNKTKKQFLLFPRFLDSYAGCFPQGKFVDRFVRKSGNCDSSPGFYINSCVTSGSLFSEVEPISNVPFSFKLYDSTLKNKTFANSL